MERIEEEALKSSLVFTTPYNPHSLPHQSLLTCYPVLYMFSYFFMYISFITVEIFNKSYAYSMSEVRGATPRVRAPVYPLSFLSAPL